MSDGTMRVTDTQARYVIEQLLREGFTITPPPRVLAADLAAALDALAPFARMADGRDAWKHEDEGCGVFPSLRVVRRAREVHDRLRPTTAETPSSTEGQAS
jgi:hypothetical protein